MNFYHKTQIFAKIGDVVATCRFGQCKVIQINSGEILCENIFTKEQSWQITNDCDLIN
jgi:hypothetical protein